MRSPRAPRPTAAPWMGPVLVAAGVYNLLWGAAVVLLPVGWTVGWTGVEVGNPAFWRCLGMVVGVYGVGYLCAARDPLRHWPIVLVGFLGKLLGPIGFLWGALRGELPWAMGVHNLGNDLIWWVPFAVILYRAADRHAFGSQTFGDGPPTERSWPEAAAAVVDQRGESLASHLHRGPVLLLAVRHSGCVYCRAELADLARNRRRIESAGVRPAILTMSDAETAAKRAARAGLDDLPRFSDPHRTVYRALGLGRGTARELFSPTVWAKGLAPFLKHGLGRMDGDGFQMGGAFLLSENGVLTSHVARNAADAPDLPALAQAP
ncbi:AhpC/TSA family protein [Alienimonas sp. DA493]|uniref:AhpC/TSA family protein n=1 Tax=Alienimonas sp. DA493 TaxID=3373605 RepID=UPI003753FDA7